MNDEPEVRVIESDSAWDRLKRIGSRPIFIIAGVIGVLLLIIVTAIVVIVINSSSEPSDAVIDYSKALIVSDERDLWALDLDSQEKTVLLKTTWGISAFDHFEKNTIYWHEQRSKWVNSLSAKYRNLTQTREWNPRAVAVDFVTGKAYVLDRLAGKLNVYDVESGSYGIAVSDLKDPIDLALDPRRGLMFIVQKSDSILKGSMDGASIEKLITSPSVSAVAVDSQTPKLYWSDSEKIESSDYAGNQRLTVIRTSSAASSLGVSGTRLFWIKSLSGSDSRTLWSCVTTGGVCDDSQQIPFEDPKTIKVYTGKGAGAIDNLCQDNNGGCQQLCLLSASSKASCACFVGYGLQDDNRSCELLTEYLLYTLGGFVRGRILDANRQAFSDAIPPLKLQQLSLDDKRAVDFDYNYYTNTLAFSDDRSVGTVHLLNESEGSYPRDRCLQGLSYDWVTDDIYYIRDNCHTAENTSIVLMKPKEKAYFWKTLRTFQWSSGHPGALVVHPNKGVYFYTILFEGNARIYRSRGLKMSFFTEDEHQHDVNETALAIDFGEDRLYWFSRNGSRLYSAKLDGGNVKSIDVSVVREPRSVSVYERYAYVANLSSIWRFDKLSGYGAVMLAPRFDSDPREPIGGVRVFGKAAQNLDKDNPCVVENGQCEQFCLREPRLVVTGPNTVNVTDDLQKVCLCEDFKSIRGDGRSCG